MNTTHSFTSFLLPFLLAGCSTVLWKPGDDNGNRDTGSEAGPAPTDTGEEPPGEDPPGEPDTGGPDDPPSEAAEVCDTLFPEPVGTRFYVDPIGGSDDNDGSRANPWASLQLVVDEYVDCVDRDGIALHGSAPIQGGDTIVLLGDTGHETSLTIKGCFNDDYVSIVADTHHAPTLSNLRLKGGSYWHFEGLNFHSNSGGQMVKLETHGTRGEVHHVRIHDNRFTSGELASASEYTEMASDGVRLSQVDDVLVSCNQMRNVANAVVAAGDRIDVLYNKVNFFSKDALVNSGSFNRYIGNRVTNAVKGADGHHDDFFQSHKGAGLDDATEIEISYNIFMNLYPDDQVEGTIGPTQCIGAFEDGNKTKWRVFNNVCKGDHYHGITLKDTSDSIIINNTVVGGGDLPGVPFSEPDRTWINVSGSGNILRNNLSTNVLSDGDHNLIVTVDNLDDIFVDWAGGDLRLRPDGIAVDVGATDEAPLDDLEGTARDGMPDLGAYEVQTP